MEIQMNERVQAGQRGFSLVELMVAMVVTLVVTGAVYGLIAGGQTAFRREPEMAERQQNIRMAMDLIMKDISNAGSGLPVFAQVFTAGLDAIGPQGPDNQNTDELEMITNSESRNTEPTCRTPGTPNQADIRLMRDMTVLNPPLQLPVVVIPFTANGQWTLRNLTQVTQDNTAAFDCTAGNHTRLTMIGPEPTGLNAAGPCDPSPVLPPWGNITTPCELAGISFANVVRYRVRPDADGVPMLERWSSDAPNAFLGGLPNPAAFQVLARGIEEMQVEYLPADGDPTLADWPDAPDAVVAGDFTSLTRQVRVRLAARSEARNIAGATTSQTGGAFIRGRLESSASPRTALNNLTLASPAPILWR
jgi:prepilin-type N-terminal cleavage/methylation domain-containing protein